VRTIERGGTHFRVAKPGWTDPLDTSFSKFLGGRWNPPGEFGAVYLAPTVAVAAANARWQHRGRAIGLFDLRPEQRPTLVTVVVPAEHVLDVVTPAGVRAVRLAPDYQCTATHDRCRPIGRRAYSVGIPGVAARSAAEATPTEWVGEELAWFDRAPRLAQSSRPSKFADWYPDVVP
jgi:RES domain-containing protein